MLTQNQQAAVESSVKNKNTFISAGPGSGKSTTLLAALNKYHEENPDATIWVTSFNTNAVKHLENIGPKSPNIFYKTTYAMGLAVNSSYFWRDLRKPGKVQYRNGGEEKSSYVLQMVLSDYYENGQLYMQKKRYADLWKFANTSLVLTEDAFEKMCADYSLESDGKLSWEIIQKLREYSHNSYEWYNSQTFDEMLWLSYEYELWPYPINIGPKKSRRTVQQFDAVFADEVQDFSPAQFELVLRMEPENIVLVGDPQQAIQFFAGAMPNSMETILEELPDANVVRLDESFRCPQLHLDFVNNFSATVGDDIYTFDEELFASDDKPGILENISGSIIPYVDPEDTLIIGRNFAGVNSDILPAVYQLIDDQIPFELRGVEFSELLKPMIDVLLVNDMFLKTPHNVINFMLQEAQDDEKYIDLIEYEKTLNFMADIISRIAPFISTPKDIAAYVDKHFSTKNAGVVVSTIHKIKGEEAGTVIILNFDMFPYVRPGNTVPQIQAEMCLIYVALTRSKHALYFA